MADTTRWLLRWGAWVCYSEWRPDQPHEDWSGHLAVEGGRVHDARYLLYHGCFGPQHRTAIELRELSWRSPRLDLRPAGVRLQGRRGAAARHRGRRRYRAAFRDGRAHGALPARRGAGRRLARAAGRLPLLGIAAGGLPRRGRGGVLERAARRGGRARRRPAQALGRGARAAGRTAAARAAPPHVRLGPARRHGRGRHRLGFRHGPRWRRGGSPRRRGRRSPRWPSGRR